MFMAKGQGYSISVDLKGMREDKMKNYMDVFFRPLKEKSECL